VCVGRGLSVCKYACLVFGSHTLCTLAHIMNMFAVTLSGEHEKSGAQKENTENWTSDSS